PRRHRSIYLNALALAENPAANGRKYAMQQITRQPIRVVDVGTENADHGRTVKYFPEEHRGEPAEKWILRLQHADGTRTQNRATDREHAEETVGRRERIGRDGFEVW